MGSKTRLSSYCTKRANNGVNLVTSRKINTRLARPIPNFCPLVYIPYIPAWLLTWKSGQSQGQTFLMKKSGKFMKNCHKSGRNRGGGGGRNKLMTNVLKNIDTTHFIFKFCQRSYHCSFLLYS